MNRYLVTTADERSWKFDRPLLFLGEWCRHYDRRHVWSALDAIVSPAFGVEPGQKQRDVAYLQAVTTALQAELSDALNAVHQTHHSLRYWTILTGHWLQRYVAVTFNRYFTAERALAQYAISGSTTFEPNAYSLSTPDYDRFIIACNDDAWNHVLFARVLNHLGGVSLETDAAALDGLIGFANSDAPPPPKAKTLKARVLSAAGAMLPVFRRKNDALIVNTSMPKAAEARFQLRLGQCPQAWQSPSVIDVPPDAGLRAALPSGADQHQGFERFVRRQLNDAIPRCYLEGYRQLVGLAETLGWPTRPRFIFTAVNFAADEVFKAWTAAQVENGTPYFVGQHGSNYGTHLYAGNRHWPERSAADRFLSWGWSDAPNVAPAIILRTIGQQPANYERAGGLLLIERCNPPSVWPWDRYAPFGTYQEEQFRFVSALPKAIQAQLTVRLHYEHADYRWSDVQRWSDRLPGTQLDAGKTRIQTLIARSRLVVHSYDSTGILEGLALNVPTMGFWYEGDDELVCSAKPYYAALRGAGILADSPEHAAELVALRWGNVAGWWESQAVQDARRKFCREYARTDADPLGLLKRILNDAARDVAGSASRN